MSRYDVSSGVSSLSRPTSSFLASQESLERPSPQLSDVSEQLLATNDSGISTFSRQLYGEAPQDAVTSREPQRPLVSALKKRDRRPERLPSLETEALSTPVSTDSELQVRLKNLIRT